MRPKNSLGSCLREERKRFGLNQSAFADLLRVSRRTQSMYETGAGEPGGLYLQRAQHIGVDIVYVLTGSRGAACRASLGADESRLLEIFAMLRDADRSRLLILAATMVSGETSRRRDNEPFPSSGTVSDISDKEQAGIPQKGRQGCRKAAFRGPV